MIDIENEIFTEIADAVDEQMPGTSLSSEYVPAPSAFPHATIVEMDNSVLLRTRSSSSNENHATVMYEVNVYSNLTNGKKSQAKQLIHQVDEVMATMGFVRSYCSPTPNLADSTVYRITARYRAVVDKNKTIYRR